MFGLPPITPSQIAAFGGTEAIKENIDRALNAIDYDNNIEAATP